MIKGITYFLSQKFFITPARLSDEDVRKSLTIMEEHIRYRLRIQEVIPTEMSQFRIGMLVQVGKVFNSRLKLSEDGRVIFNVPNLFETSISLRGTQKDDGWFFVHVEFLHGVSGDVSEVQGMLRDHLIYSMMLKVPQNFLADRLIL